MNQNLVRFWQVSNSWHTGFQVVVTLQMTRRLDRVGFGSQTWGLPETQCMCAGVGLSFRPTISRSSFLEEPIFGCFTHKICGYFESKELSNLVTVTMSQPGLTGTAF